MGACSVPVHSDWSSSCRETSISLKWSRLFVIWSACCIHPFLLARPCLWSAHSGEVAYLEEVLSWQNRIQLCHNRTDDQLCIWSQQYSKILRLLKAPRCCQLASNCWTFSVQRFRKAVCAASETMEVRVQRWACHWGEMWALYQKTADTRMLKYPLLC